MRIKLKINNKIPVLSIVRVLHRHGEKSIIMRKMKQKEKLGTMRTFEGAL